jgi:hypothetical protein
VTEPNPAGVTPAPEWQIRITQTAHYDYPARTVLVGPYPYRHQAEACVGAWKMLVHSRTGIAESAFEIGPYDGPATPAGVERIDGYVPLDTCIVADMMRAEGGPTRFPDTWDLLTGLHGHDDAARVHQAACAMLDNEAAAAEDEEEKAKAAAEAADRRAECRKQVARHGLAGVYTEPILGSAAAMLDDMFDAAERYGVHRDRWGDVTNLPMACVMLASQIPGRGPTIEDAAELGLSDVKSLARQLVAYLADKLDTMSVAARDRGPYGVVFDSPHGGRLAVSLGERGWEIAPDTTDARPLVNVYAPYTREGAEGVAQAVADIVAGRAPHPFDERVWP